MQQGTSVASDIFTIISVASDIFTIIAVIFAYLGLKQWRKQEYEKDLKSVYLDIMKKSTTALKDVRELRYKFPKARGDEEYKAARETFQTSWLSMTDLEASIDHLVAIKGNTNDIGDIDVLKETLNKAKSIDDKIINLVGLRCGDEITIYEEIKNLLYHADFTRVILRLYDIGKKSSEQAFKFYEHPKGLLDKITWQAF